MFASFLGGSGEDACFVLKISPINGDIYVAGATSSKDIIGNKAWSYPTVPMVVMFQTDLFQLYVMTEVQSGETTYLGTSGFDAIYGIEFDKLGFPYVMGSTTGVWKTTSKCTFINKGAKQFVCKLKTDLSDYIYSTTFGSTSPIPNISRLRFW